MKSFKIRDKYYPATAILSIRPPLIDMDHRFIDNRWHIEFVEGHGSYLIDDHYNDELIVADLCDYFGIPKGNK